MADSGDTTTTGSTGDTTAAGGTGDTTAATTDGGAGNTAATTTAGGAGDTSGTASSGGTTGTTPTPAPKAGDAEVPRSILEFAQLVHETWNMPLTATVCLHRHQRNVVRNALRGYMSKTNTNDNASGAPSAPTAATGQDTAPADLLSYPYMLGSSYYQQLMSYRQLQTLSDTVRSSRAVNTVGQYVLYLVTYYMTVGREHVSLHTARDPNYAPAVLTIMAHKILNRVYEIHTRKQCKYMFVGVPSYYWHGVSAQELLTWGAGLLQDPSMKLYSAYLRFLAQNQRDVSNPRFKIEYMGESWNFRKSVPEFALEGLCYRGDDNITRYDASTVRVYVDKTGDNAYSYYEYPALGVANSAGVSSTGGVPVTSVDYSSDVSAFSLRPPASEVAIGGAADPYSSLGKLITPEECGTQLTDEDPDPVARDESKDTKLAEGQAEPSPADDLSEETLPGLQDEAPGAESTRRRGDLGSLANSVRLIKELEDRVTMLAKDHTDVVNCCSTVSEGLLRLERHAETLRKTMLALVRKINVQTGRTPAGYGYELSYE